jgi:hypothetical protein
MAYKTPNKKSVQAVQPPCKKTTYYSAEEAMDMIKYLNENLTGKELRPYKCSACGFWHLTSRPAKSFL